MKTLKTILLPVLTLILLCGCSKKTPQEPDPTPERTYSGSASCLECHEKFYKLWAPSHHAKALQPWSAELAAALPEQESPIEAEGLFYVAHITPDRGWISDDQGKEYDIKYAMGGKNYYNFLTLMDDGRLQVLPIFYDVQHDAWRNTTLSMLRHFSDGRQDTAVSWRDPMLTFNAECFRCHVSQSESNYDPETDTYETTWKEAGISCESCHGPCSEHIRVCKEAPEGTELENLELIRWSELSIKQQNDSCAGCHTKGAAISKGFETGDDYWDHYDLTTFDHPDYYANGRDLGENYTMGSWWLSPCATEGSLSCTYCHTSSGRYKFKGENANEACLSCHQERRKDATAHMHHKKGGATKCTDCHMAQHTFGGMNQSDHSMRPPMPNLSIAVGSRNACTICHEEKSNEWALENIRKWHPDFDQHTEFEMRRALLVQALRNRDWTQLPAALEYINDPESDPLFITSIIRLLPPSNDPQQHKVLRRLTVESNHPLVRSAAAMGLDADNNPDDRPALLTALSDKTRLVRVRAATGLAAIPEAEIPAEYRDAFREAMNEMWESNNLRLDNWGSHFNAANILMRQQRYQEAAAKYDRAHELRDDIAPPLINSAMALANLQNADGAEARLLKATQLPEPSAEAHFNLGLLYAEQNKTDAAITQLKTSLNIYPENAPGSYNLAILLCNQGNTAEGIELIKKASELVPQNPRYLNTYAYYLNYTGQTDQATKVLEEAIETGTPYGNNYFLLGSIYEAQKKYIEAIKLYSQAIDNQNLPMQDRQTAQQAKARAQQQLTGFLR